MKMDAWWVYQTNDSKTWAYDKPSLNAEGMPPNEIPNENYPSTPFVWDLYGGVGGGPMLVFDSENVALPSFEAEVMWGSGVPSKSAAARTAIGTGIPHTLSLTTEQLLLIIVDGSEGATGISLGDLSEEFLKLGARKACNLDGGGSTELAVNGALTN